MCKKKYRQVRSCLNRLISYFYNIKFYNFYMCVVQCINDQNNILNCVKGQI